MLTLRDQHYAGKYLVIAQSELNIDYLIPFMDKDLFNDNVLENLKMDDNTFLKADSNGLITQTNKVKIDNDIIGKVDVLIITKAEDFMSKATECKQGESVQYINNDISLREFVRQPREMVNIKLSKYLTSLGNDIYKFNNYWYAEFVKRTNIKTLNVKIKNPDNITIIKMNSNSIYIRVNGSSMFNNYLLNNDVYKIDFAILERSASSPREYFMQKSIYDILTNYEQDLISAINDIIKENS